MTERSRQALIAIRRIIRATEFSARNLARETGLTNSQLVVLRILADGEATPGTIAHRIGLTQATVTALIDRLMQRGFVNRRRGEEDRRRVWLTLSESGRALLQSMPSDIHSTFLREFDGMEDWEQAMLVATLERVASMLKADTIDAGPILELGEIAAPQPPA